MDNLFEVCAGAFDRVEDLNARTAAHYGIPESRVYADWREMLEAEKGIIDAVVVLTPTPTHAEVVIAVLNAGVPVICEKALATSTGECRDIRAALERGHGFLAITYNYSGYPMVRELRQRIGDGDFGRIQQILIEMPQEGFLRTSPAGEPASPQPWRLADINVPTVSLDLGVHVHHLIHFLTPQNRPVEVVSDEGRFGNFERVIDNVHALARYSGDMRVHMWYGKTALGIRNGLRFRVFGERGAAEWFQMDPETLHLWERDGSGIVVDRSLSSCRLAGQRRYNRFKPGHPAGFHEAFANLYADFAEVLRARLAGKRAESEYVFGIDHAEEGLRVLEAIDVSARERRWVQL
jgi:predicted dehydrogenase